MTYGQGIVDVTAKEIAAWMKLAWNMSPIPHLIRAQSRPSSHLWLISTQIEHLACHSAFRILRRSSRARITDPNFHTSWRNENNKLSINFDIDG
jgi:hypothetical protein